MIVILLLLLLFFIFWYYTRDFFNKSKLDDLQKMANHIIQSAHISPIPKFKIYETNTYPHTIRNNIYLVIKRPDGRKYDPDTISFVLCHELAHLLSGVGDEHGKEFEEWEGILLDVAEELGYYYKGIEVASDYPCYK
jgi:predicted metal-dependent hydrolase